MDKVCKLTSNSSAYSLTIYAFKPGIVGVVNHEYAPCGGRYLDFIIKSYNNRPWRQMKILGYCCMSPTNNIKAFATL